MSVTLIVGIFIGIAISLLVVVCTIVLTFKYDGDIVVKYDDAGEGPYFFLEAESPRQIEKKPYVIFKVKK